MVIYSLFNVSSYLICVYSTCHCRPKHVRLSHGD